MSSLEGPFILITKAGHAVWQQWALSFAFSRLPRHVAAAGFGGVEWRWVCMVV